MVKIRMLPFHEAQKIAAGEVVERPASVVKELLENALDAGATRITLTIKDGGKSLIRVADDGCGMSVEDARLCIQKHATSKITCIDDLNSIATFGFRGEALAALAAVSRMTLITKEASTHEGIKFIIECGEIIKQEPVAAQTGTTIEIVDLFYNVPARQKFLKKRETEFRHIQQLFHAMSLAHPHVYAQLYSEDSLISQYAPTVHHAERCEQVITHAPHQKLIAINAVDNGISITGSVSDHQWFKYDRSGIFLFVNKRWVKNQTLTRAVMRGYGNVLPSDRFPVGCIMIEVPADDVDVNVHPRKEEVQFVHAHRVENMVSSAIKKAFETVLSQRVSLSVPFMKPAFGERVDERVDFFVSVPPMHRTMLQQPIPAPQAFAAGPVVAEPLMVNESQEMFDKPIDYTFVEERIQMQVDEEKKYTILGQLYSTYILVQTDEGLVLVDQHAAHERILYEQFASRFTDVATVQLLFPEIISLTQADWQAITPYMEVLQHYGIILEEFGAAQLRVLAVPVHLKHIAVAEIVHYFVGIINENERVEPEECMRLLHTKLRAQMACKAAVKAGDVLDERQMQALLTDLYKVDNCLTCPHGRPTYWQLSQYEIEKKFKRIV